MRFLLLLLLGGALSPASAQVSFEQQMAHHTQPSSDPLDLNTASARQLNALPGFGPAYTRRLIAGRPYTAKNQLVQRGILPPNVYAGISDLIVAHRPKK